MRNPSQHIVKVFDPNRDPSVAEMLKEEQDKDQKVTSVRAHGRFGLVQTSRGTFALNDDGIGPGRSIDERGIPVPFYRHFDERPGHDSFEPTNFATATYSLADCEATLTGETMLLDQFIRTFSAQHDRNYEMKEKTFS